MVAWQIEFGRPRRFTRPSVIWVLPGLQRPERRTQRSVEQLPHVDQLVDETRGARFFTKLLHQARVVRASSPGHGLYAVPDPGGGPVQDVISRPLRPVRVPSWRLRNSRHVLGPVLMRYLHHIFGLVFDFWPGLCRRPAGPMMGRFVQPQSIETS